MRGEGGRIKEGGQKIGEERRDESRRHSHTSIPTEARRLSIERRSLEAVN